MSVKGWRTVEVIATPLTTLLWLVLSVGTIGHVPSPISGLLWLSGPLWVTFPGTVIPRIRRRLEPQRQVS